MMSVCILPNKPLEPSYSPRQGPLPVLAFRSHPVTPDENNFHPPLIPLPKKMQKSPKPKKESKKKKKKAGGARQKRSKSCPPQPIEGDTGVVAKKKVKLPTLEAKKSVLKVPSCGNMAVVGSSKQGKLIEKRSAPMPRQYTSEKLVNQETSSNPSTQIMAPLQQDRIVAPKHQVGRVRFIALAKLKETEIKEKLKLVGMHHQDKKDAGFVAEFKGIYKPVLSKDSVFNRSLSDDEQPTAILKHRKCRLQRQLSVEESHLYSSKEHANRVQPVNTSLNSSKSNSGTVPKLKKQLSAVDLNAESHDQDKPKERKGQSVKISAKDVQSQSTASITAKKAKPPPATDNKAQNDSQKEDAQLEPKVPKPRRNASSSKRDSPADTSTGNEPNALERLEKISNKIKKNLPLLTCIKPENQESEKDKFFKSNFHYNPQFVYRSPASPAALERFSQASDALLHIAVKIMRVAIKKYGTYEKFEEKTGGQKLSRAQIAEAANVYLKNENLQDEVTVMLSDDLLSRACMTRMNGRPTLQVRTGCMRENWVQGMLRHEIGTHYLRSCNNRQQIWQNWKKRRDLDMRPLNPTEEGLASLHSVIFREDPNLWRCAFLYYVIYQASRMSFVELFRDVGQFVKDPYIRWDYCLRAKRGMEDTSQPGAFCKDQVYLKGALQILKNRRSIDFHLLIRAGKVDYRDIDRLRYVIDSDNTRIPSFMKDIYIYKLKLEEIFIRNKLADCELESIEDLM